MGQESIFAAEVCIASDVGAWHCPTCRREMESWYAMVRLEGTQWMCAICQSRVINRLVGRDHRGRGYCACGAKLDRRQECCYTCLVAQRKQYIADRESERVAARLEASRALRGPRFRYLHAMGRELRLGRLSEHEFEVLLTLALNAGDHDGRAAMGLDSITLASGVSAQKPLDSLIAKGILRKHKQPKNQCNIYELL